MQYDWSPYKRRHNKKGDHAEVQGVTATCKPSRVVAKETSLLASGSQIYNLQNPEESGLTSGVSHWSTVLHLASQRGQ